MQHGPLKPFLCLALSLAALPASAADAPRKRDITLDDLVRLQRVGPPVVSPEGIKMSYPFLEIDKRVHTPMLFMGGTSDMNVPILGGEQMYQALRSLGRPAELVVYPGQFHGFTRPSYIRDRYERWLAWWDKYLKPPAPAAETKK
jgi:dipeptidyl aminopeptidase/acylaminoacyl peptidase